MVKSEVLLVEKIALLMEMFMQILGRLPAGNSIANSLPIRQQNQKPSGLPAGTSVPSRQSLVQLSTNFEDKNHISNLRGPQPEYAFPDLKRPPSQGQEYNASRSSQQAQVNAAKAAIEYEKLAKIPEGMRTTKDKQIMKALLKVINNTRFVKPGDFEALKQQVSAFEATRATRQNSVPN